MPRSRVRRFAPHRCFEVSPVDEQVVWWVLMLAWPDLGGAARATAAEASARAALVTREPEREPEEVSLDPAPGDRPGSGLRSAYVGISWFVRAVALIPSDREACSTPSA